MDNKLKCKCGKIAIWYLMSSSKEVGCCDDCVPRGCSCNECPIDDNWDNLDAKNWKQELDVQGRLLPCCEWYYSKEGWENEQ